MDEFVLHIHNGNETEGLKETDTDVNYVVRMNEMVSALHLPVRKITLIETEDGGLMPFGYPSHIYL